MIEDKFGAELLGLWLPVSCLGHLPPLQAERDLFPILFPLLFPPPRHRERGIRRPGHPDPSRAAQPQ